MLGVNQVILLGKVYNTKTMTSKNGKPITFFTLTTYKRMGEGEKDKALFHSCVAYGKLAEILGKYLHDGKELYVDGTLDYYEKDGITKTQIVVVESQFTSAKEVA
jgi:single-strand DNA-binding protein